MFFMAFLAYFLVTAAPFSYGIGFNFLLLQQARESSRLFKLSLKAAASTLLTTAILWLPFSKPQLSAALSGLLPLLAAFISFALNKALSMLLPDDFTDSRLEITEALFVFSSVILSIKEGVSFLDALAISLACPASFAFFLFLKRAVLSRLLPLGIPKARLGLSLAMVLLGIFSFIQPLFDIICSVRAFNG